MKGKHSNIKMNAVNLSKYLYFGIKRIFDIIVSLIGLIVSLPIFLIVSIAIKLEDGRKVLIIQNRIGKNGKEFKFYKFQSMVENADELLVEMLKDPALNKEFDRNKKIANDPRITKVGRFIRKTSIDELPQLLNVLKGDMSFIGNRPYLPREKEDMAEYFEDIVKTKPGLTGYWQVSGRDNSSFRRRLVLERYYSNHCNLILDIKIFFKTFSAVLKGHGAAE